MATRLHGLAERWEREIRVLSNADQVIAHPAHKAIVRLGDPVVPPILERMQTRGG